MCNLRYPGLYSHFKKRFPAKALDRVRVQAEFRLPRRLEASAPAYDAFEKTLVQRALSVCTELGPWVRVVIPKMPGKQAPFRTL